MAETGSLSRHIEGKDEILPRRWKWPARFLAVVVAIAIAGELILRFGLGLGDPPLMTADTLMSYRFSPSQTCHRFHHLIHYNAYSMRSSDEWEKPRSSPAELRVLFIGDSVINGGSATDQAELATSVLEPELSGDLHRPVMVGNASCGGWGPPSELGWVRRFGLLDADIVVLVLNSSDFDDVPHTPCPVGRAADMPDHKPWSAWQEFVGRYVLPRLWHVSYAAEPMPVGNEAGDNKDLAWCADSIRELIQTSHKHGARVILVQSMEREELDRGEKPGHGANLDTATSAGVDAVVQLGPALAQSRREGHDPFRTSDNIHLNAIGQRLLATEVLPAIEQLSKSPATRS